MSISKENLATELSESILFLLKDDLRVKPYFNMIEEDGSVSMEKSTYGTRIYDKIREEILNKLL